MNGGGAFAFILNVLSLTAGCGVPPLPERDAGLIDARAMDAVIVDAPVDAPVDARPPMDAPVRDATATDAPADARPSDASSDAPDAMLVCEMCAGECIETWHDPLNCGSCGNVCPPVMSGEPACVASTCTGRCGVAYRFDGTACVRDGTVRLVGPLSTATVTSHQPTLRWELPTGATAAHVQLCSERACTTIDQEWDATGSSATPPTAVSAGWSFWRAYPISAGVRGTTPSAMWQFYAGSRSAPYDTSRGSMADVNGDGLVDIVAGGPLAGTLVTGVVRQFIATGVGAFETSASVSIDGEPSSSFGYTIAVGDWDGDGLVDLVAPGWPAGDEHFYTVPGSSSGLDTARTRRYARPLAGTLTAAFAGDVNGDGYADAMVNAPSVGDIRVYLGGPVGLRTPTSSLSFGIGVGGRATTSLGDLDGDGRHEVAFGAGAWARVHRGTATGIDATPLWEYLAPAEAVRFGCEIAGGDFDGDGRADLAVGAAWGEGDPAQSRVYVFRGTAGSLFDMPDVVIADSAGMATTYFGDSLLAVDANGDGYDDLAVGAKTAVPSVVYLYRGGATGISTAAPYEIMLRPEAFAPAADADDDGRDDLFVGGADRVHLVRLSASALSSVLSRLGPAGSSFGQSLGGEP